MKKSFIALVSSLGLMLILFECKTRDPGRSVTETDSTFNSLIRDQAMVDSAVLSGLLFDTVGVDSFGIGGLGLSGTGRGGGGTGEGAVIGIGKIGTKGKGGSGSGYGRGYGAGPGSSGSRTQGMDAGIGDRGSLMAARGSADIVEAVEYSLIENVFVEVKDWNEFSFLPSTAIDSWEAFLRLSTSDSLPPPDQIQIHEILNGPVYYRDTVNDKLELFSEAAPAPWQDGDYAWLLTVRAPKDTALFNPAWNIVFNEDMVKCYRLLGQEDYLQNLNDTTSLILNGGLSSHAMFQLKLLGIPSPGDLIAEVEFSFETGDQFHSIQRSFSFNTDNDISSDMQFALSLTEAGLWLRNSEYKGTANPDSVFARMIRIPNRTSYVNLALRALVRHRNGE